MLSSCANETQGNISSAQQEALIAPAIASQVGTDSYSASDSSAVSVSIEMPPKM